MKSYLLRINIMRQRNPMQPSKNQQTNIFDPLECSVSHLQGEAVWYLTPIIFWPIILWLKRSSWPIILKLPLEGWLVFEAIIPAQGSSRSRLHSAQCITYICTALYTVHCTLCTIYSLYTRQMAHYVASYTPNSSPCRTSTLHSSGEGGGAGSRAILGL